MSRMNRADYEAALAKWRTLPSATMVSETRDSDEAGPYVYGTLEWECEFGDVPRIIAELGTMACEQGAYLTLNVFCGRATIGLAISRGLDEHDEPKVRTFVCSACGRSLGQHSLESCDQVAAQTFDGGAA